MRHLTVLRKRAEIRHKPNIRSDLIFKLFKSLIFTPANLRDSKSKMSLEEDSSEILDPIVTTISFSSMKILIFNQSPNLLMCLQKISHVFISKRKYLFGTYSGYNLPRLRKCCIH